MDASEFSRLVDELLAVRGAQATQRKLADQLGCHPRTIGRYKCGERTIPSPTADRLRAMWHREVGGLAISRSPDQ